MCFAIDRGTFSAGGSQPKHVSNPDSLTKEFKPHSMYEYGAGHVLSLRSLVRDGPECCQHRGARVAHGSLLRSNTPPRQGAPGMKQSHALRERTFIHTLSHKLNHVNSHVGGHGAWGTGTHTPKWC